jgi:hypothetical protein
VRSVRAQKGAFNRSDPCCLLLHDFSFNNGRTCARNLRANSRFVTSPSRARDRERTDQAVQFAVLCGASPRRVIGHASGGVLSRAVLAPSFGQMLAANNWQPLVQHHCLPLGATWTITSHSRQWTALARRRRCFLVTRVVARSQRTCLTKAVKPPGLARQGGPPPKPGPWWINKEHCGGRNGVRLALHFARAISPSAQQMPPFER